MNRQEILKEIESIKNISIFEQRDEKRTELNSRLRGFDEGVDWAIEKIIEKEFTNVLQSNLNPNDMIDRIKKELVKTLKEGRE